MEKTELKNALKALNDKKIILYPTDTVWGLGCDATDEKTVSKIYRIKQRKESKSLVVLVSSVNMLQKYVKVSKKVRSLIQLLKAPMTIIYKDPKGFANNTLAEDNSIAIRVIQDDFCKKLIKKFGKPIVSTSANISEKPTPKSFKEIDDAILNSVDYVVNLHRDKVADKPSTILRVVDGDIQVLRA